MKRNICISILTLFFASQTLHAQHLPKGQGTPLASDLTVQNQFVMADVGASDGFVTVLPIVGSNKGRLGLDAQLSFFKHSYFTCKIGSAFFTNNEFAPNLGANLHTNLNTTGQSSKIVDVTGAGIDTIRTIWSAANQNGVEIIQDIFCITLTKSGQVVYSWKFRNTTGSPVVVACQYLNDIEIADPQDTHIQKVTDGPKILTRFQYDANWTQFPNTTTNAIPPFYIGFDQTLPAAPTFNPGISGMGYLTFDEPLNLITPIRYTNGAWPTLAMDTIFGPTSDPTNLGVGIGSDNGILLEFAPVTLFPGKTVEVGRTSYGTGEFEQCAGNLFGIITYPHRLVWNSGTGHFAPSPFEVDMLVMTDNLFTAASNTKLTLTVGNNLNIVGPGPSFNFIGKIQTLSAQTIQPEATNLLTWFVQADATTTCANDIISTLSFTGTSSLGPPTFINDTCQHTITLACSSVISSVSDTRSVNSTSLQNYPNPFSSSTTFNYALSENGLVKLYLYDELGKEIARIFDNTQAPGSYSIDFDGSKLPTGNYIVRLESGGGVVSRKVIIER